MHHGALVDQRVLGAVGVDHPDAIHLLPHAFVAVHDELRVGRREQHVADPVGGVEERLDVPGLLAVGAGLEADGEQHDGNARGQAALHHRALVVGLHVGSAERRIRGVALRRRAGSRGRCSCRLPAAATAAPPKPPAAQAESVRRIGIAARAVGFVVGAAPSVSSALTLEMLTRGGRSISLRTSPVLVSAL